MSEAIQVRVTHIADAADQCGIAGPFGAGNLTYGGRLGAPATIGRAFTVQQRALAPGEAPAKLRHAEAVASLCEPGHMLVIQVAGETEGATWGEAHTLRAVRRNLAGALVDGNARDASSLPGHGFHVLYRAATPLRSAGRLATVSIGAPVTIRGVTVRSGDVLALDADGFVCLSPERAEEVLARARQVAEEEAARDGQIVGAPG